MSALHHHLRTRLRLALIALPLALGACGSLGGGDDINFQLSDLTVRDDRETAHAKGVAAFSEGRYGLAVKHFSDAVAGDPGSLESINGLAASYDRLGRYDLAERYYKRALALDPNSTQTLNNIGYSYLLQKRFDVALLYLREAEYIASNEPAVQGNLTIAQAAAAGSGNGAKRRSEGEDSPSLPELLAADMPRQRGTRIVRRTSVVQELLFGEDPQSGTDVAARPLASLRYLAATDNAQIAALGTGEVEPAVPTVPDESAAAAPAAMLPPREPAVVEVANGVGRIHMANRFRDYLSDRGVDVSLVTNADHFGYAESTVYYRDGWRDQAEELAAKLPTQVAVEQAPEQTVDIRLRLGRDLAAFDQQLVAEQAGPLLMAMRGNSEV